MSERLHFPAGTLGEAAGAATDLVVLDAERAGWRRAGLRVVELQPGRPREIVLAGLEAYVLPLSGGCRVSIDATTYELAGRESVFAAVTDFAFAPRDSRLTLVSPARAEIALCTAVATSGGTPAYVPAEDVPVEVRGAGPATRQVTNFGVPGVFDGASRVMACELLTPGGNWSSYPPHRHDHHCDVANEEIYYFRIDDTGGARGTAVHRTYDDELDATMVVGDGDVCIVPHGYHGPTGATPGYDLYYLNVLAGDGERSMAFCDDPEHHWLRDSWERMPRDPRCPLTSAAGRV